MSCIFSVLSSSQRCLMGDGTIIIQNSKYIIYIGAKKNTLIVRMNLQFTLHIHRVSAHKFDDQFLVMYTPLTLVYSLKKIIIFKIYNI